MNQVRRRPQPRKPKDERTKFDKWLDRMCEEHRLVTFHFEYPPLDVRTDGGWDDEMSHDEHRKATNHVVFVIEVDRYMVCLGFPGKGEWWINKSIISAASEYDSNRDEDLTEE